MSAITEQDLQQADAKPHDTFAKLEATALRVKSERDEAVWLLREVLNYHTLGSQGPMKTRVREFLARLET